MTLHSDLDKNGFAFYISEQMMLHNSWFPKKGHVEEIPLTDEDRAEHARAVLAYEECMSNSWINIGGYDYEFEVLPLVPRSKFIPEESDEEHMARWVQPGRPVSNPIQEMVSKSIEAMSRRLDADVLLGDQKGEDA